MKFWPCHLRGALAMLGVALSACAAAAHPGAPAQATQIAWIWLADSAMPAGFDEAAVLVEQLVFTGAHVRRIPRTRPFGVPSSVRVTPLIHVQARPNSGAEYSPAQRQALLDAAERHARSASSGWLQLDFEAPARQRDAYVALVRDLRLRLPASLRLSVTALAGWCVQGGWLASLHADEIVPMLYRLGPDAVRWRSRWADPGAQIESRCRAGATGFSVQEAPTEAMLAGAMRRYWFNERTWRHAFPGFPK